MGRGTLSKLPTLLAGPILRRVEPTQVCIWIACSKAVSIRAEIFRVQSDFSEKRKTENTENDINKQTKNTSAIGLGSTKSIRLGENLYIGLVIARPIQPCIETNNYSSNDEKMGKFPTDELLAYDVEITYSIDSSPNHYQKKTERLNNFGLLSGKNSIVFNNAYVSNTNENKEKTIDIQLPTFFIRGKNSSIPLNLLYGSCRKLHGKGEDCIVIADEILSNSVGRPRQKT
jgi:hypothetical protein